MGKTTSRRLCSWLARTPYQRTRKSLWKPQRSSVRTSCSRMASLIMTSSAPGQDHWHDESHCHLPRDSAESYRGEYRRPKGWMEHHLQFHARACSEDYPDEV